VKSKVGRFMEGLDVVGGVTTVSNISICMCLISIKMHVCDACGIIMYFIAIFFTVDFINFVC
jgi:hypothetical protein